MKISKVLFAAGAASFVCVAAIVPAFAQQASPGPAAALPDEAAMMAMAKPGPEHQMLAALDGTWTYAVKFAAAPGAPLADAGKGTAVRKSLMGGRYFSMDVSGKMAMPDAGGKMTEMDFKGMSLEGFDNVKKKFISTWIDSMGTSIMYSEGSYDPASKALTYSFEEEFVPGMKTKGEEVITFVDADHHRLDWYEIHGEKKVKTMEISYAREK